MNDSLYSLNLDPTIFSAHLEWNQVITNRKPCQGLFNYGLAITEKGKLILHGGLTKNGILNRITRNLTKHSTLWIISVMEKVPDFQLVTWPETGGGFSKIVSLGGEKICILNKNIQNELIILDIQNLIYFYVNQANTISPEVRRNGYGVVSVSNRVLVIVGGYTEEDNKIGEIKSPFIYGIHLKDIESNVESKRNETIGTIPLESSISLYIGVLGILPLLLVSIIIVYKKHINKHYNTKNC
jgi:hypothetical protein